MKDIEIMASCYSKKEDASIEFATSINPDEETIDALGLEWITAGMGESFWENHFEFEPGIEKAKQALVMCPDLTFREALYDVFGDFIITYQVNGEEVEFDFAFDVNQIMYDMLEV